MLQCYSYCYKRYKILYLYLIDELNCKDLSSISLYQKYRNIILTDKEFYEFMKITYIGELDQKFFRKMHSNELIIKFNTYK